jgi:hypothetical protein
VADVGEEEAFGDDDVGSVLVGGGVGGALIGVPFPTYVDIAALLLVVSLLFLPISLLVVAPVTITRQWTFSNKMTGLTTFVVNFLGAGLVILPPPLLEDLAKTLDDELHNLVSLALIPSVLRIRMEKKKARLQTPSNKSDKYHTDHSLSLSSH